MSMAVFPSQTPIQPHSHHSREGFSRGERKTKAANNMREILPRPNSVPPALGPQSPLAPKPADISFAASKYSPCNHNRMVTPPGAGHSRESSLDAAHPTPEQERRIIVAQDFNSLRQPRASRPGQPAEVLVNSQRSLPPLRTQNLPLPQLQPNASHSHPTTPIHAPSPTRPPMSATTPMRIPAAVLQIASNALSPGQGLFENAWRMTSLHVQVEMAKMHNHYTNVYETEKDRSRQQIARLKEKEAVLKEALEKAKQDIKYQKSVLMRENRRLAHQVVAEDAETNKSLENEIAKLLRESRMLAADNSRLQQKSASDEVARARLQQENNRLREELQSLRETSQATGRQPADTEQKTKDLHTQLTSIAQLREEKTKRLEAERKLSEVQEHLRMIASDSVVISPRNSISPHSVERVLNTVSCSPESSPRMMSVDAEPTDRLNGAMIGSASSSPTLKHDRTQSATAVSSPSHERYKSPSVEFECQSEDMLIGYESEPTSPDMLSIPAPHRVEGRAGELEDDGRPRKRMRHYLEDDQVISESASQDESPKLAHSSGMGALQQLLHAPSSSHSVSRQESTTPSPKMPVKGWKGQVGVDESHRSGAASSPNPQSETRKQNGSPRTVHRKLGVRHIHLLYDTSREQMECRMCIKRRQQQGGVGVVVKSFPQNSSWAVLVGHYESEHESACAEFEKLSPSRVVELQQHMKHAT